MDDFSVQVIKAVPPCLARWNTLSHDSRFLSKKFVYSGATVLWGIIPCVKVTHWGSCTEISLI